MLLYSLSSLFPPSSSAAVAAHPAWLRSFVHLLEKRVLCALCFCPLRFGKALLTNGERPLTWLFLAQNQTSGLGFILPESSYLRCDVCVQSVNPVIVRGDPVSYKAKETGWCFNLSNVDVSLRVSQSFLYSTDCLDKLPFDQRLRH